MTLDDEQVRFYLRHRDQLEEWIELRPRAAAAIDEWLTRLGDDIKSLGVDLGEDAQFVSNLDDRSWPSMYLKRAVWPGQTVADATALIGLEWERGKTVLAGLSAPYVLVWCQRDVARAVRENAKFQEKRRRAKDRSEPPFCPAWRYVLPVEPFPEKADDYRRVLVESIRDVWATYAPSIDAAVVSPVSSV